MYKRQAYKSVFSECNSLFILHEDLSVDIKKVAFGLILIFCGMITLSAIAFSTVTNIITIYVDKRIICRTHIFYLLVTKESLTKSRILIYWVSSNYVIHLVESLINSHKKSLTLKII